MKSGSFDGVSTTEYNGVKLVAISKILLKGNSFLSTTIRFDKIWDLQWKYIHLFMRWSHGMKTLR